MGADMLVKGIRERVFVPPLPKLRLPSPPHKLVHARKIQPEDREVDWRAWGADAIERRYRALGALWNNIYTDDQTCLRVRFEDFELVQMPPVFNEWCAQKLQVSDALNARILNNEEDGQRAADMSEVGFLACQPKSGESIPLPFVVDGESIIVPASGGALRISRITAAGMATKSASFVAEKFCGNGHWPITSRVHDNSRPGLATSKTASSDNL